MGTGTLPEDPLQTPTHSHGQGFWQVGVQVLSKIPTGYPCPSLGLPILFLVSRYILCFQVYSWLSAAVLHTHCTRTPPVNTRLVNTWTVDTRTPGDSGSSACSGGLEAFMYMLGMLNWLNWSTQTQHMVGRHSVTQSVHTQFQSLSQLTLRLRQPTLGGGTADLDSSGRLGASMCWGCSVGQHSVMDSATLTLGPCLRKGMWTISWRVTQMS